MPYSYRKTKSGYTVFKRDTGKVVGHTTKANLKKYLAALHMHAESNNTLNWIREEITRSLKEISTEFGAYRRVVIISPKMKEIKANIKELLSRKEIKSQYKSCKVTMKDGVKPNMLVVDFNGEGATGLAAKAVDLAKKHDNNAEIKVRKEKPLSNAN